MLRGVPPREGQNRRRALERGRPLHAARRARAMVSRFVGSMHEQLEGPDEDESEDAQRPRQRDGVGADARRKRHADDVEPETRDGRDRHEVDDDHPERKPARLHHAPAAELDDEDERQDGGGDRAGQRPGDGVGDVEEVQERGHQRQRGDQEAPLDVEAHEAEVPIGDFTLERPAQRDDDRRESDERQRERCEAEEVVRFGRGQERVLGRWCAAVEASDRGGRGALGLRRGKDRTGVRVKQFRA